MRSPKLDAICSGMLVDKESQRLLKVLSGVSVQSTIDFVKRSFCFLSRLDFDWSLWQTFRNDLELPERWSSSAARQPAGNRGAACRSQVLSCPRPCRWMHGCLAGTSYHCELSKWQHALSPHPKRFTVTLISEMGYASMACICSHLFHQVALLTCSCCVCNQKFLIKKKKIPCPTEQRNIWASM